MASVDAQVAALLAQVRRLKVNIDAQGQAAAAAVAFPRTASSTLPIPRRTVFDRNLEPGMRGTDVKALQERLIRLKIMHGTSTGYYGEKTRDAVGRLQRVFGMPTTTVNGHFGPMTRSFVQYTQFAEPMLADLPPVAATSSLDQ